MFDVFKKIALHQIVPVLDVPQEGAVEKVVEALVAGGLPVAEITLRSKAALPALMSAVSSFPNVLFGAGTVSSAAQVDEAVDAGAQFIVTPGINPAVISRCFSKNIPVIPGVCTPSDVETARAYELDVLKFFPAEAAGGVAMLDALAGPYKDLKFIPTGGISPKNLLDYISCRNVMACGGSWMVKKHLIEERGFDTITHLTQEALSQLKRLEAA